MQTRKFPFLPQKLGVGSSLGTVAVAFQNQRTLVGTWGGCGRCLWDL